MTDFKPFDYINSIISSKENLLRGHDDDEFREDKYPKFVVNRGLAYYPNTVLHASAINQYPDVPKRATYEFLLNSIRPGKRFAKWEKAKPSPDIDLICEVYNCNTRVARSYLRLLSEDDLADLRKQVYKGGAGKPRK